MKGKVSSKKKGSTILMVLMISTILIIVSAVMMNSLVITTHANDLEKNESDYLYAAEGGIEYGVQKYKSTGATGFPFTMDYLKTIDSNPEKGIKEVKVSLEEYPLASGRNCIISTVYGKDDNEFYKIVLPVSESTTSMTNILRYALCSATTIEIKTNGASDFQTSQIGYNPNYQNRDDDKISIGGGTAKPDNYNSVEDDENAMEIEAESPNIKEERIKNGSIVNPVESFGELLTLAVPMEINPNDVTPQITGSVGKANLSDILREEGVTLAGNNFEIILVNGDLEINCLSPSAINNKIIIVSGKLKIIGPPPYPDGRRRPAVQQMLTDCTLYAQSIIIEETSDIKVARSPLYPVSDYNIKNNDILLLDKFLQRYMNNWGASGTGGAGGSDGDIKFEDVEYIN